MKNDTVNYREVLGRLEAYCAERDFAGYCKFDALHSPLVRAVCGHTYLTRLLATQLINRIPGLRPLVGMPRSRNPKGIANFIRAYCKMENSDERVRALSDWLLTHDSAAAGRYEGPGRAWGYHFPWQSPGFFQPANAPNCIVTVFCGEALLDAFRVTGDERYRGAALGAGRYLLEYLPVLEESREKLCIGYVRGDLSWRVVNINAVAAGFLARLHAVSSNGAHRDAAVRLIRWVIEVRDPQNQLWNYTDPASASGIGPDSYHTGGILEGLGVVEPGEVYWEAMELYRTKFFTADMAPCWRLDRDAPFDIHGSAQAILTFVEASRHRPRYLEEAKRAADWAIENLRDARTGRFYYQRYRFFTWKVDLMRWNNSWMMRALAELCRRLEEVEVSR